MLAFACIVRGCLGAHAFAALGVPDVPFSAARCAGLAVLAFVVRGVHHALFFVALGGLAVLAFAVLGALAARVFAGRGGLAGHAFAALGAPVDLACAVHGGLALPFFAFLHAVFVFHNRNGEKMGGRGNKGLRGNHHTLAHSRPMSRGAQSARHRGQIFSSFSFLLLAMA